MGVWVCICRVVVVYPAFNRRFTTVRRNSITVDLQDDSEAIVAHVCANSLILPRGLFMDKGSYQQISNALEGVLKTYNIV